MAPEAPAGGIAGTGVTVLADVSAHNSVAPPPPPATVEAFSKKSEESNGVIALLDVMIKDLTKELTEAKTTEKLAQEDCWALFRRPRKMKFVLENKNCCFLILSST